MASRSQRHEDAQTAEEAALAFIQQIVAVCNSVVQGALPRGQILGAVHQQLQPAITQCGRQELRPAREIDLGRTQLERQGQTVQLFANGFEDGPTAAVRVNSASMALQRSTKSSTAAGSASGWTGVALLCAADAAARGW